MFAAAKNAAELLSPKLNISDPSTIGLCFMACLCALLPLDISQLTLAILGAVLYAWLQKYEPTASSKKTLPTPCNSLPRATVRAPPVKGSSSVKPKLAVSSANPELRKASVQPIAAPTFKSQGWEGEIQELLVQIAPTPEVEEIVNKLVKLMKQNLRALIPEIEITGFASGNLTSSKAFGVAVPEVDIVASVSPQILFARLHGRDVQNNGHELDTSRLHKAAIRTCTDRLVSVGGLKFRRSAFRGQEPKVTLLVPQSLGLFAESFPFDFSVNVVTPFCNAAVLSECNRMESRAKDLMLLVKRWAKDRGICHAAKGHLSPYVWNILTIYFLQVGDRDEGPLLPPFGQFKLSSGLFPKCHAAQTLLDSTWEPAKDSAEQKSVAALFRDFIHFFSTQFNWGNEAVSVCLARRAPPSLGLPLHIITDESSTSQVGPSIEDPFHKAQNLGEGMNAHSFARLKEELSRANALCAEGISLTELLEPWAPPVSERENSDACAHGSATVESGLPPYTDCRKAAFGADTAAKAKPPIPPWRVAAGPRVNGR
jgi:hypothetical protein